MIKKAIASLALVPAISCTAVLAHDARHQAEVGTPQLASTYYAFPLPEPGSYELPPIKQAAGGRVLDENGGTFALADFFKDRITILAFIYTRCGDICPVASLQLSLLHNLAAKNPGIAQQMHLISMSFDPEYDTPKVMAEHAKIWRSQAPGAPDWQFLTAPDNATLAPILKAYDQTVRRKQTQKSSPGGFYHIFRGFLIDDSLQIRNIYSLDFLEPALVLNDVRTLIAEKQRLREHINRKTQ